MPEKTTFDYIDGDPLVQVTLINPVSDKKVKAYAYLDTGSDTVVIPRDLWLKLGLQMLYRSNVCAVIDKYSVMFDGRNSSLIIDM